MRGMCLEEPARDGRFARIKLEMIDDDKVADNRERHRVEKLSNMEE